MHVGLATSTPLVDCEELYAHALSALQASFQREGNALVAFDRIDEDAASHSRQRSARKLLDDRELGTAFQPIWDLEGDRPLGFEATARPSADYALSGAELHDVAEAIGRTSELDELSWRWALTRAEELTGDIALFLPASNSTGQDDASVERLRTLVANSSRTPEQVVLVFTEKSSETRELLSGQTARLRAAGFKIALDNVGAHGSDPDIVEAVFAEYVILDASIVKDAPTDAVARGMLSTICGLAGKRGSHVIAAGVDNETVLRFLREELPTWATGTVRGAQGTLLGRPADGKPVLRPAPYPPMPREKTQA